MGAPEVPRVADAAKYPDRLRKFTEIVSLILNSLLQGGYVVRTGVDSFKVVAGAPSPLTTKGDILGYDTAPDRIPVGADNYILTSNSADPLGVSWVAPGGGGGGGADPISSIYPSFAVTGGSDEFSAGTFPTGWTAVNSGAHLPTATNTNNVLSLLLPGSDASGEMHAWVKAPTITAGSFVECAVRGLGETANFHMAGVLFADGQTYTAGKQVAWYILPNTSNVQISNWTNYSTQGSPTVKNLSGLSPLGDIFLRLVYNGANSWTGLISPDGISWVTVAAGYASTMTPTRAGFFVSTFSSANPYAWCFRYIRLG